MLNAVPRPLVRACAWFCVALLCLLSWLPGSMQYRTSLGGQIEHAFAYFVTGGMLAVAYPHHRGLKLIGLLCAYAALLEAGQFYVPGRSAQVSDWLVSSAGATGGILALTRAALRTKLLG